MFNFVKKWDGSTNSRMGVELYRAMLRNID